MIKTKKIDITIKLNGKYCEKLMFSGCSYLNDGREREYERCNLFKEDLKDKLVNGKIIVYRCQQCLSIFGDGNE